MKHRASPWAVGIGGVASLLAAACQSAPTAAPGAQQATGAASSSSASAPTAAPGAQQATGAASSSSAAATSSCAALRDSVVAEAGKLSPCESDADCKVHRVALCDFNELDCYAAHVHVGRSTTLLDDAVSAYAARCDVAKCKCGVPSKSVCRSAKCTAG